MRLSSSSRGLDSCIRSLPLLCYPSPSSCDLLPCFSLPLVVTSPGTATGKFESFFTKPWTHRCYSVLAPSLLSSSTCNLSSYFPSQLNLYLSSLPLLIHLYSFFAFLTLQPIIFLIYYLFVLLNSSSTL